MYAYTVLNDVGGALSTCLIMYTHTHTWDVSSVMWNEPCVPGIDTNGCLHQSLGAEHLHRLREGDGQPLLFSTVLLQCLPGDDGVALPEVLPGFGDEACVATHVVLLRVVVRHVEGRDGMLLPVGGQVGFWPGGDRLQGRGVLGQGGAWFGGGVALEFGYGAHLVDLGLMLVLVVLEA